MNSQELLALAASLSDVNTDDHGRVEYVFDAHCLQAFARELLPASSVPLSDARLHELFDGRHVFTVYEAARLVEQAHGIQASPAPQGKEEA